MIIPAGPGTVMHCVQSLRNTICKPIPEWQKTFSFQESSQGLVHAIVNTIAGLHRTIRMRHMAATRVILVE